MKNKLVGELFGGPVDIVGDIHGEIDALSSLLVHLGYDDEGRHPDGRRLVFIGDLADRGPDSPAVIDLVSGLVSKGLAQCVLGNHELNLLRKAPKEGNGWFCEINHDHAEGKFLDCRPVASESRSEILTFLASLPLALERSDLRVVHAAWHSASIEACRSSPLSVVELYEQHHATALQLGIDTGLKGLAESEEESAGPSLKDKEAAVPMLSALAAMEALYQDANPVRIITSGLERVADEPFFATGKWRMVNRHSWWQEYQENVPVIIGHYWRWPTSVARESNSRGEPDLFQGHTANQWLGAKRNVFCVDFAVGARYKERKTGIPERYECRLAAVRWPERELMFDDGERMELE